jgi:hypothetical protein
VGVASASEPKPVVAAVLDPAVPAGDPRVAELRINFMEFVRLEIARTWWVVSHPFPWRVKLRLLKEPGRWRNGRPPTIAEKGND